MEFTGILRDGLRSAAFKISIMPHLDYPKVKRGKLKLGQWMTELQSLNV